MYSEESPSNDAFGMGVLTFGRLHHLNLHAFEEELATELVDLQETKTADRGKILRVRRLLAEYCEHELLRILTVLLTLLRSHRSSDIEL